MSFCGKCGTQIEGANQQFCPNCGERIEVQPTASNGAPVMNAAPTPVMNQPAFGNNPYMNPAQPVFQHPMGWFKFLIYFLLFFGAFINVVLGISYMTGGIYYTQSNGEVTSEMVYFMFGDGLKVLDVVYGILLLAMAAFEIYTRFRLAKFKSNGPLCICILYGAGAVLSLVYIIALYAITGLEDVISSTNIVSIITSVVFIALNYTYFKKRKELFVN